MPSTAFDTFFACTIIVTTVMIATAFLGVTLQARISSTDNTNKDSYLKAIADHIITSPGSPTDWGTKNVSPSDFGLATYPQSGVYRLDIDKVSRLNIQNTNMLSYIEIVDSAKLNNMSIGITIQQVMDLSIKESNTHIVDGETYATLTVTSSINSKPTSSDFNCYVVADNYFYNTSVVIPKSGSYTLTVHVPTSIVDGAYVLAFARAAFDERITSFAVYNIAAATQETSPVATAFSMSPQNYLLSVDEPSGVNIENVYSLTYSYNYNVTLFQNSNCAIPHFIDNSPILLVACGQNGSQYLTEWTSYPQVPLSAGSTFQNSERNLFSYLVTIEGVLYRVEISLGAIPG
jgi:hypothetical protein